jgi:hypothetical protein
MMMKKKCLWFGWPQVASTGNRKALEKGWKKVEPAGKGDWTSWDGDKRPCGTVKNGEELDGEVKRAGAIAPPGPTVERKRPAGEVDGRGPPLYLCTAVPR